MAEPVHRIDLALAPALIARIERWRGRQPTIPTRAAAIRLLVEAGLAAGATSAAAAAPSSIPASQGGVAPLPNGKRGGDASLNVRVPGGVYDLVEWVAAVRACTKREAVIFLVNDAAPRLARELGAISE